MPTNVRGLGHKMREMAKDIVEMEYRGRERRRKKNTHTHTCTTKKKQDNIAMANWASYNIETIAGFNHSKMRKT